MAELDTTSQAGRGTAVDDLERAIASDELFLVYQPIASLGGTGRRRVEAFVRWRHELHGVLRPGEIVRAAERLGLTGILFEWVLSEALRETRGWRRGGDDVDLTVNVSAPDIGPGLGLTLAALLEFSGTAPGALTIDIPERATSEDPGRAAAAFRAVRDLGVRVAIDDFGAHPGSLALLRALTVDELKLAPNLVSSLVTSGERAGLAAAILAAAWTLGVDVVAGGVDDAETLSAVRLLGCERAQGFAVAPPMTGRAALGWLARSA